MSEATPVCRGARTLRCLLREQTADLRGLDLAAFRAWLDQHLARWQQDPVFVQRAKIRDLRRAHPRLGKLERACRRAAAADAASPQYPRLGQLERELAGADKAIAGLTASLGQAVPERRAGLQQKLDAFRVKRRTLRRERAELIRASPPRRAWQRLCAALRRLRAATGLDAEEARLAELLRQSGRRSGRSGASFEDLVLGLARQYVLPDLLRGGDGAAGQMRILRKVRLGAAQVEFDLLVVLLPNDAGMPVDVLAAVEAKRNVNDLAHGFRRRQEDLAWLTGETGRYDPDRNRTAHFPFGHFDRAAAHRQDGETFRFAPGSFGRFHRDAATGLFLDRLYLVTRAGPLWGCSAAALGRIAHRVATDTYWLNSGESSYLEPDRDAYLRELFQWCQSLAEPVEAPDVLRLYTAPARRGRQVLLVGA